MPTKSKTSTRVTQMFDVVVIGGGSAGIAAIEGAKAAGARAVCLVEAEARLGGECAHWACVPTKALLKSAQVYHTAKFGLDRYGTVARKVTLDMAAVWRRRDAVVSTLTGQDKRLPALLKRLHVSIKHGWGKFLDAQTLEVDGHRIRAKAFVIATGSQERVPDIAGLDTVPFWYSRDVVRMEKLPASVAIVGGGPIGSEFATLFGLFGVKTVLLEIGEHILPREDREIAVIAESHLRHLGVQVITKTKTLGVRKDGKRVKVTFQTGRRPRQSVVVDQLIVAVGREPKLAGLDLAQAGLKLSPTGHLPLSQNLHTKKTHIFGAGDAVSAYQFTHYARQQGFMAGWNAAQVTLKGKVYSVTDQVVPHVTFVEPEAASVGMTVAEAVKAKKNFTLARFPFSVLGRAAIDGQRDGLCKIILDAKTDQILGAHVIGERAGEIIHELALAIHAKVPFATVQSMLHAYPSWSEVIPAAKP